MGTDIRSFLECLAVARSDNAEWGSLASVDIDRDYVLFGILGRVLGDSRVTPLVAPRGIPEQMAWRTEDDWDRVGGSYASYLTYHELLQVQEIYSNVAYDYHEARWVPKEYVPAEGWSVYSHERDLPRSIYAELFRRAYIGPLPEGYGREDVAIAVRHR